MRNDKVRESLAQAQLAGRWDEARALASQAVKFGVMAQEDVGALHSAEQTEMAKLEDFIQAESAKLAEDVQALTFASNLEVFQRILPGATGDLEEDQQDLELEAVLRTEIERITGDQLRERIQTYWDENRETKGPIGTLAGMARLRQELYRESVPELLSARAQRNLGETQQATDLRGMKNALGEAFYVTAEQSTQLYEKAAGAAAVEKFVLDPAASSFPRELIDMPGTGVVERGNEGFVRVLEGARANRNTDFDTLALRKIPARQGERARLYLGIQRAIGDPTAPFGADRLVQAEDEAAEVLLQTSLSPEAVKRGYWNLGPDPAVKERASAALELMATTKSRYGFAESIRAAARAGNIPRKFDSPFVSSNSKLNAEGREALKGYYQSLVDGKSVRIDVPTARLSETWKHRPVFKSAAQYESYFNRTGVTTAEVNEYLDALGVQPEEQAYFWNIQGDLTPLSEILNNE